MAAAARLTEAAADALQWRLSTMDLALERGLRHAHARLKLRREMDELRGRPRMQAELVDDFNFALLHTRDRPRCAARLRNPRRLPC